MKVINFFGLKRAGNHALINWILANSDIKNSIHINNVYDLAEIPSKIVRAKQIRRRLKDDTELLILSYEDVSLNKSITEIPAYTFSQNFEFTNIILLRDFYNFIASRMRILKSIKKAGAVNPIQRMNLEKVKGLWLQYAEEYKRKTNFLDQPINISYNHWFLSKQYRDTLIKDLFGKFCINMDKTLKEVPTNGRGSSFDGINYNGNAHKMKVLERWKIYFENPTFRGLVEDSSIENYNEDIFEISMK